MKILTIAFMTVLFSTTIYAFCFEEAGEMYGISPDLLRAIAQVESSMKPHVVNYNENGSYDYGLMQINTFWYRKIGHELWMKLGDPCMNVKLGAWVLADCIKRHGYTWKAVGCYHSPSPKKQEIYIVKVRNTLKETANNN